MTSEAWVLLRKQVATGNVPAFEQLYNALWSRLYSIAYNYVRDTATAQEIVQEVFIKLWLKRADLHEVNDIHAFAVRAVQFRIYDFFDKRKIESKYAQQVLEQGEGIVNNTHHLVEYNETLRVIEQEIRELPDTTQHVFRLSRFEQLSNEEISNKLKISIKTVEYHITQSLKHLRMKVGNFVLVEILFSSLLFGNWDKF
jgi:RNA polymerase sigma-70 factor (ECF subfamily)